MQYISIKQLWNNYGAIISIGPSLQGINRHFVLSFENAIDRTVDAGYYLPKVEMIMIDVNNFFHQPIQSYIKSYANIKRITIGNEDDYTTGCLLDYPYFKENYKMIAIS